MLNQLASPPGPRRLFLGPISAAETSDFSDGLKEAVSAHESVLRVDIDSPGGSVSTMLRLMREMKDARAQGMEILCFVDGMAASAGAVIFETSCSKRYMTATSSLLFHEPAIGDAGGKEGDLRRAADSLADTNKRMAILVAPHLSMTPEQYMSWIADRDRWLGAGEALLIGAVDELR